MRHENAANDDYFLDSYSHSKYYPHEGNSSITTSVTIRVTPEHYHVFNWALLWTGFLLAMLLAVYQLRLEKFWAASKERRDDLEQQQQSGNGGEGEGGVSSAEWTRSRFRRLLLFAMITRAIMIPVQMWSNPIWAQFMADTFPEMTFASAWTLLVSFFIQLVGVASGTGSSASPGLVIQITAYVLYAFVMGTYFWNPVASVLLYALLCCIYAALFGTALYFCPRLLLLLQPSLSQHSALAIRLSLCSVVCVFVFGARTFGFARKVVAPPDSVSWWWEYGVLELIPSIMFLFMMHPKAPTPIVDDNDESNNGRRGGTRSSNHSNRSPSPGSTSGTPPTPAARRQDDPFASKRSGETVPFLKPGLAYGTVPTTGSADAT